MTADPTRHAHFVIIGAQRCGTTYLSNMLDEHPEIEMARPQRPEPKFFLDDTQFDLGLDEYERRYFSGSSGHWLHGEKSTSYIESPTAAARIGATLPGARVIAMLRDPVARAVSNYVFTRQNGLEPLALDDALRAARAGGRPFDRSRFSVSPFDYLRRGLYAEQLEHYAAACGREQVVVVFFEELVAGSDTLADVYGRLGVDPTFRPAGLDERVNAGEIEPPAVDASLETWLRAYYREPNERLARFVSRPIDCWPL